MLKIYSSFLRVALLCVALMFGTVTGAQAGFLYVLNDAAPNRIYGFSVNETTGALTLLAGFPINTGGNGDSVTVSERLTIDRVNNRLYVINSPSATVSAFSINPMTGALTALPFSPIALGVGNWYTIAVHPSGSPLVVGDNGNLVRSFAITAATATEAPGSPYTPGNAPFSSAFSRDGNFYYVGSNGSGLAGFSVNAGSGQLTALAGSPFNPIFQPLSLATDSSGRIFTTSTGGQMRVFTTAGGIPTGVSGNPFASGLTTPIDGALHPNENFYALAARDGNNVGSYQIAGMGAATTLTAVGAPVASGGSFTDALVFNSMGTFLFAANGNTRNITTYGFNPMTGTLTFNNVQPVNTLGTPGQITGIDYLPTAPTAASVSVGGRLLTADGRGIRNAVVTMTAANGVVRTATSSSFGYYRFDEVGVGETYIFAVRSKRYQFTPQVVSVAEELTELNFTAEGFSGLSP